MQLSSKIINRSYNQVDDFKKKRQHSFAGIPPVPLMRVTGHSVGSRSYLGRLELTLRSVECAVIGEATKTHSNMGNLQMIG